MEQIDQDLVERYQKNIPLYKYYDGVPFPGTMMRKSYKELEPFRVRPDDVLIAGFPRSGNHWIKEIVSQLYDDDLPHKDMHVAERMPILEFSADLDALFKPVISNVLRILAPLSSLIFKIGMMLGLVRHGDFNLNVIVDPVQILETRESPRVYHTHLPFKLLPKGIRQGTCKTIYVIRNGKDVSASFYEMHKMYPPFGYYPGSYTEFMAAFNSGQVCFGSWFDHVNEWWSKRDSDAIMYVHYEDMIEDLPREVARVAKFLGKDVTEEGLVKIVDKCNFKNMRKKPSATFDGQNGVIDTQKTGRAFLRKGKVADWKSRMSVEDSENFDEVFEKKFLSGKSPEIRFQL